MSKRPNPWLYVPLLYFTQSLPVVMIQELSQAIYKDLGVADGDVARWTALLALPWSLQMILGPFVDLNFTKRGWITAMQVLITAGLLVAGFCLRLPNFFTLSLVTLGISGVFSAFCNIAIDGFAILAMEEDERGKFAGIMSTCYRLGRLFVVWLVVWGAGMLLKPDELQAYGTSSRITVQGPSGPEEHSLAKLYVDSGILKAHVGEGRFPVLGPDGKEIKTPMGITHMRISGEGVVTGTNAQGEHQIVDLPGAYAPWQAQSRMDTVSAWSTVFMGLAVFYGLLILWNWWRMPTPEKDTERKHDFGETVTNALRVLALLGSGLGGYFLLNSVVRLCAHWIWQSQGADAAGALKGWMLPDPNLVIGFQLPLSPVMVEVSQFVVCAVVVFLSVALARKTFPKSEVAESITTFFRQPNIIQIVFFIVFYRFSELLISKMTTLFLKSSLQDGGLAVANEQLGQYNGVAGILGLVAGGIVGGWFVQKWGLKKSFLPLALSMHIPNVLYYVASIGLFPKYSAMIPVLNMSLDVPLMCLLFFDQFGYGFGFTGFMVYLIWVAQRGKYQTSHYAFMTGLNALVGAIAGVLGGLIRDNWGFTAVFLVVLAFAIPGLISLWLVPLDESHKKIRVEVE